MRIQIFLLIFVVGFTLVGESYGQGDEASQEDPNPYTRKAAPQEHPSLYEVSLQMQLRNSEGQLITYIEPTTMYILNINRLHQFLDTKENKTITEIDGKMFEVIEYELTYRFGNTRQYATLGIWHIDVVPLLFRHDAYISSPGDTLDASWRIVRTIQ